MDDEAERYNGWKNYETWCMALWIDNDEASYDYSRELVREADPVIYPAWADSDDLRRSYYVGQAADALKAWKKESLDSANEALSSIDGFLCDLLSAAWGEIDWHEIAENYLSEVTA